MLEVSLAELMAAIAVEVMLMAGIAEEVMLISMTSGLVSGAEKICRRRCENETDREGERERERDRECVGEGKAIDRERMADQGDLTCSGF